MKFGVLTFHNIPNYGAALQAYALCKALREMGAKCEIIDYRCENITLRELTFKKSTNLIKTILKYILSWLPRKKRITKFNEFMKNSDVISEKKFDKSIIVESNFLYDAFISGSDMIWDLKITNCDHTYFLDFVKHDKYKFSYASSTGEDWGDNAPEIISMLKKYDCISVREDNVQKMLENNGLNCKFVCDPTMLLKKENWLSLTEKTNNLKHLSKGYVLVYFPYDGILEAAKKYAVENHLEILVIGDLRKLFCGYKLLRIYEPISWLNAIKNADTVFTDSYHGVLFSMYFNKKFWTNNRCNRIESVLNAAGLSDRFIDCGVNTNAIDYNKVDPKLDEFRQESLEFLSDIIKITEEENK